jgi:hypothetical protein
MHVRDCRKTGAQAKQLVGERLVSGKQCAAMAIKFTKEKGLRRPRLERELRVVQRLNCDIQHDDGQNCSKVPIPSNPVISIYGISPRKHTTKLTTIKLRD